MKKKLLAILISTVMLLVPCTAFAAELLDVTTDSETLVQQIDNQVTTYGYARIWGSDRYNTAYNVAETLLAVIKSDRSDSSFRFETVIVASGENYPDALGAGPLAYITEAPIFLVNSAYEKDLAYKLTSVMLDNDSSCGAYIMGGTGAVSDRFVSYYNSYRNSYQQYKRLAGSNRYSTNLATMKEYGADDYYDILICSGTGFADSLSASATGYPIMLVGSSLTTEQLNYLKTCTSAKKFTIIGGTGAVSSTVEKQLKSLNMVPVRRIAGSNRYETSYMIANEYFPDATDVVLAYGESYPDGLAGSGFAAYYEAPLILCKTSTMQYVKSYVQNKGVNRAFVLGGPSLISDSAVKSLGLK